MAVEDREPKVGHFDLNGAGRVGREHEVVRLEVAVEDAHLVAVQHRLDDAAKQAGRPRLDQRPRCLAEQVPQRAAGAQLLYQEDVAFGLEDVAQLHDLRGGEDQERGGAMSNHGERRGVQNF